MLPGFTFIGKVKTSGMDAAWNGEPCNSPYTSPELKAAWEAGWRIGDEQRLQEAERNGKGYFHRGSRNRSRH